MPNNEQTELLVAMNMNLKSGLLSLLAVAIQIRDGEKGKNPGLAELEDAAELLRLSTSHLTPMYGFGGEELE